VLKHLVALHDGGGAAEGVEGYGCKEKSPTRVKLRRQKTSAKFLWISCGRQSEQGMWYVGEGALSLPR
jgi:hypothetical protein